MKHHTTMKNKDDKLDDLAKFLHDQINKLKLSAGKMDEQMYECDAVWLTYKVNGSVRVPTGSLVQIKDEQVVADADLEGDYATHKIIGIYSTIGSTRLVLICLDVITNEPTRIIVS